MSNPSSRVLKLIETVKSLPELEQRKVWNYKTDNTFDFCELDNNQNEDNNGVYPGTSRKSVP